MKIACYEEATAAIPIPLDVEWSELLELLSDPPEAACAAPGSRSVLPACVGRKCAKKDGEGWSPVDIEGSRRCNEAVRAVTVMVVDLDHLRDGQLEDVIASVEGATYAVHSTHSHAPGDGAYRLVMPLSRPALPAEWAKVRRGVVEAFGLPADPSTKDLSRFYYWPTRRDGVEFFFNSAEGEVLDVDEALAAAGAKAVSPSARPATSRGEPKAPAGAPIDLGEIRKALAKVRRSKASGDEYQKEQAALLGLMLEGKPIAEVGGRHAARVRLAGLVSNHVPSGTTWEASLEVMRPCLDATPLAEGETRAGAYEKTRELYAKTAEDRRVREALKAAQDAAFKALSDRARGKAAIASPDDVAGDEPGALALPDDEKWQEMLLLSKAGVRGVEHNAQLLLACAPEIRGSFRWNVVAKRVEVVGGVFANVPEVALAGTAAGWLQRHYEFQGNEALTAKALLRVALQTPYDPIAEYLHEVAWDGDERLDRFLEDYLGADVAGDEGDAADPKQQRYVRAVSRRWLIGLVARALRPGCQHDSVLVLEGAQGVGKSTALQALVGGTHFLDTALELGSKDTMQAIASAWLVELAELASFRRAETEKVKQFLSAKTDKFRPPYGAVTIESPRRCVFVGTTNESDYLKDQTGNRRYLPVRVFTPRRDLIARDRDMIFAEAVAAFAAGERWHFDPVEDREVLAQAARETDARLSTSTTEEAISRWWHAEHPGRRPAALTMLDVAEQALHISVERIDHGMKIEIGNAMRKLGFEYKLRMKSGERARKFVPSRELAEAPQKTTNTRQAALSLVAGAKVKT